MRLDSGNPISKFVKGVHVAGQYIPAENIIELDLEDKWVWVLERDANGKPVPRDDGLEPVTSRVYAPFVMEVSTEDVFVRDKVVS